MIGFTLSFEGNDADNHTLDLYDAAQAMIGFHRSLAITTHLILNGEVITQAPSLKNARILTIPPEEGSWKIPATIVGSLFALGTASQDSPIGNIMYSAYDYVISESMGFHVDYNKTLGQQYDELQKKKQNELPIIKQSQLDSVIEKCEYAIQEMHRPIVKSKTASLARVIYNKNKDSEIPFKHRLNNNTYNFIRETEQSASASEVEGRVSSYNINTYKGRIFIPDEQRPIPFDLSEEARAPSCINKITNSLNMNAKDRSIDGGNVKCIAFRNYSKSGRLKSLYVVDIK